MRKHIIKMGIAEIYKLEHSRNKETINKIYLYKEKNTDWFHGYEWSAWLCEFFDNKLDADTRLKPTHKNLKESEDGIIMIGLMATSLKKYLPDADVNFVNDSTIEITVDVTKYPIGEKTPKEILSEWKAQYPIKERKKKERGNYVASRPSSFSGIMQSIIRFHLETSTSEENVAFIRELKTMCADLI